MTHSLQEFFPQINENHMAALLPAYLDICNASGNHPYLSLNGLLLTEADVRTWFSTHMDDGIRYFAAADAAEINGISVLRTTRIENAELMVLAVRPEAQCQGIGGSLLDHALQTVRVQGYRTLLVKVFADNRIMQRLLLSRAFQPIRMEHHGRWDGGDIVWWKKTF